MTGPIALHGGAEFLPGDEPVVLALLEAGRSSARSRASRCGSTGDPDSEPVRVVVVPAAASPGGANGAARLAVATFERVARNAGIQVAVMPALVVDRDVAAEPTINSALAGADLVHLPGGDPALVPATLADTPAWRSILAAHARGAVVAGASAGAMGLADETWTQSGWRPGLGLVHGLVVVPHYQQFDRSRHAADADRLDGAGVGWLGLDEKTAVIREAEGRWRVVGEGHAHWFPSRAAPAVAGHDEMLPIPA